LLETRLGASYTYHFLYSDPEAKLLRVRMMSLHPSAAVTVRVALPFLLLKIFLLGQ
jgi:hypothetical protein